MAFHLSIIGEWRLHSTDTQKIERRKCLLLFEHLISVAACQCNDNPSHTMFVFQQRKKKHENKYVRLCSVFIACVRVGACKFPKCEIEIIIQLHFKYFKLPQWRWAHNLSANSKNVFEMWNANFCQILHEFCVFCRCCVCIENAIAHRWWFELWILSGTAFGEPIGEWAYNQLK